MPAIGEDVATPDVYEMTSGTIVVEKAGDFDGNISEVPGIVKAASAIINVEAATSGNTVTFTADRYAAYANDGTGARHYYKDGAAILTAYRLSRSLCLF
jgi:hypothetical protein